MTKFIVKQLISGYLMIIRGASSNSCTRMRTVCIRAGHGTVPFMMFRSTHFSTDCSGIKPCTQKYNMKVSEHDLCEFHTYHG